MKYKLLVALSDPWEQAALAQVIKVHFGKRLALLEAQSGPEALARCQQEAADILLLDTDLPGCSGLAVAEAVRQSHRVSAIIFISSHALFSYAKKAIDLRAMDFILRPWQEEQIIRVLEESILYLIHFRLPLTEHYHAAASRSADAGEPDRLSLVRRDIQDYIENHYSQELSMRSTAKAMNYSESYFCRIFRQCFHTSFSDYLNDYRISRAQMLMEDPHLTIKEISAACGYADSNYFARIFKRRFGLTPSAYRLRLREKG